MDLAYVDKLAKDNNGVKYLPVRQIFFDRTVKSKGMKTKDSKELVRAFFIRITQKNRPEKFELTKEQNLLERLKNYGKLNEYQFNQQWVKPRLHLQNVQYDPWKINFTATWNTMEASTFTNWLKLLQH